MSRRFAGFLGLALAIVLGGAVSADEPVPAHGASQARVEIASAGFSLALPAGWRGGVTSEGVRTSMVVNLSPSLRDLQTWVLYAEEPIEEAWCAVADMTRCRPIRGSGQGERVLFRALPTVAPGYSLSALRA